MQSTKFLTIIGILLTAYLSSSARAEEVPKWELGMGLGAFSFPAYRGSSQTQALLLPVPYFTYHGTSVKADREGLRGVLFNSDRLDLTFSVAGSPPAKSGSIDERLGMPDLQPTFELGPRADYTLWRERSSNSYLKLRLPVRAAFTVERSPEYIGWLATPSLTLSMGDVGGWRMSAGLGPLWASQKQHAYFYSVDSSYATTSRPAYQANGGYSGFHALAAVSRRIGGQFWVGAFARYDNLTGTAFADSPLVARRNYLAGGLAISYIFASSSEKVNLVDD